MSKISALDVAGQLDGSELFPMVQGSRTRRATFASFANLMAPLLPAWQKGEAGGNVMSIGLFDAAGQIDIPAGADLIHTAGHGRVGLGAARYSYDPTIDAVVAADRPFDTFVSKNGRGFKLTENVYDVTMFGAVGDGVTDDAPAIQRALDAIVRSGRPGAVLLAPGKKYRCHSGLVIQRGYHNFYGYAVLDFSGWVGVYVTVQGGYTEYGNSNGFNGAIEGQVIIIGAGRGTASTGMLFDSALPSTATGIRMMGLTVGKCGIAFAFGRRGYNQEFINCKAFECDVIFDWPAGLEDADERQSVFGGTYYNSGLFVRNYRGAGAFYVYGASIDYTEALADIFTGKVQLFGCHLESKNWQNQPVKVRGNRGLFSMHGGWLFNMENTGGLTHYFLIEAGCKVLLSDVITHNCHLAHVENGFTPTTWATGPGDIVIRDMHVAYEYGRFPLRHSTHVTQIANHNFERENIQESPIWRYSDVLPIRSRDGSDNPIGGEAPPNMRFERVARDGMDGAGALRLSKTYGGGSPAAAVVLCVPVRYGESLTAGLRVKLDPQRPGNSNKLYARGGFAILDGHDQYRVPVIQRFDNPGEFNLNPVADDWMMVAPGNAASEFVVPSWANHYIIIADLRDADGASFLIDGRWADRF